MAHALHCIALHCTTIDRGALRCRCREKSEKEMERKIKYNNNSQLFSISTQKNRERRVRDL